MEEAAALATPEEIRAQRRGCWNPDCKRSAFIRDWKGWKWCLRCWWRQLEKPVYHFFDHRDAFLKQRIHRWYIEFRYLKLF